MPATNAIPHKEKDSPAIVADGRNLATAISLTERTRQMLNPEGIWSLNDLEEILRKALLEVTLAKGTLSS